MYAPQTITITPEPMIPFPAVITDIKEEAPSVTTYTLEFEDTAVRQSFTFQPGQFNMLYLPGIGEAAISISSDTEQPEALMHTIREAGNVTQAIARLDVGDVIGVRGPYGSSWPLAHARGLDVIIVAGGIGLPPLRPAIYHIMRHRQEYGQVTVLVGAREPADLIFPDEYDAWREQGIEVLPTVDRADDSWEGRVGVVPMLFYSLRPDARKTMILTCGPEIMMRFVVYEALARRIPKERIYLSLERNMKCAIGFCGRCQFGPTFLCKEGPTLSYNQIEPFFSVEEF
jgi:NAD(P)H-flavin reductase